MTGPAELDLERFAADDRFVRALLRRFVSDPNAVDDMAQETWLAVLRQSTGGSPSRAWLSTVARNFAFQTLRGNQRRLVREASVAKEIAIEADGEGRRDSELRGRVLAAVAGLEELYREIVRLRYFEDATPSEIAEKMGLPVETVRTRIKRGVALVHLGLLRSTVPGTVLRWRSLP